MAENIQCSFQLRTAFRSSLRIWIRRTQRQRPERMLGLQPKRHLLLMAWGRGGDYTCVVYGFTFDLHVMIIIGNSYYLMLFLLFSLHYSCSYQFTCFL